MRILGIDPGLSGAFALIDTGLDLLLVRDMPIMPVSKGKHGVCPAAVTDWFEAVDPDIAYLERVHAMPEQGVSSSFNFGLGYGIIQGALGAKRIPFHLITPQEWKKHFRLSQDKGAARGMASRLFPRNACLFARVKDDGRAEASLIAAFGLSCSSQTQIRAPRQHLVNQDKVPPIAGKSGPRDHQHHAQPEPANRCFVPGT